MDALVSCLLYSPTLRTGMVYQFLFRLCIVMNGLCLSRMVYCFVFCWVQWSVMSKFVEFCRYLCYSIIGLGDLVLFVDVGLFFNILRKEDPIMEINPHIVDTFCNVIVALIMILEYFRHNHS